MSTASNESSRNGDETSPNSSNHSEPLTKVPLWLPISAFVGTSLALAIPLFMLRRRGNVLRVALKDASAPPPRRTTGVAPPIAAASSSSSTVQAPIFSSYQSESASPGIGELRSALSQMTSSSALLAGKALAIATAIVGAGGFGLTWAVKTSMGIQDAREFGQRVRMALWTALPGLTARINRPPETEEERQESHQVAPFGAQEEWSWDEAEKRLKRAYDEGGVPLWAQAVLREMEAEACVERLKRLKEVEDSLNKDGSV